MIINRNDERFMHLKGEMFSWHQDFFFPLPEKLFYEMDLTGRILAWSEERDNYFFSLGNLYWDNKDNENIKWKLRKAELDDFYYKIKKDDNKSIRINTAHFDKCLKTYIALNEIANNSDGYLFIKPRNIDNTIERYLGNRNNRKDFTRQYDTLEVKKYPHSDDVMKWVLSLEFENDLTIGKHAGADITLPNGKISKARFIYKELEIMPVLEMA